MFRLQTKLILSFLIIGLIPLLAVSVLGYQKAQRALHDSYVDFARKQVAEISHTLRKDFEDERINMEILAQTQEVRSLNPDVIEGLMREYVKRNPLYSHMLVTDMTGLEIAHSMGPGSRGHNIANKDYFFVPAKEGEAIITDAQVSTSTGRKIIAVGVPIKDASGKTVGVLDGFVYLKNFSDYISQIKLGKTGYAFMVSKKGILLSDKNEEKILKENLLESKDAELKNLVQNMVQGGSGAAEYRDTAGVNRLVAYAPVGLNGWSVAVTVPTQEVFTGIDALKALYSIAGLVAALVIALTAYLLARMVVGPIRALQGAMQRVKSGDLTQEVRVRSSDEIGVMTAAFNEMLQSFRQVIRQTLQTGEQVARTSHELSATAQDASQATLKIAGGIQQTIREVEQGSQTQSQAVEQATTMLRELNSAVEQIAVGAQEQARNVHQTSGTMTHMSQVIDGVNQSAAALAAASTQMSSAASKGGEAVRLTVDGMEEIRHTVFEFADKIRELGGYSQQIGEIVQVISDIADQTNLLALNAAIEAARAGEHGKGFAVVAEEVRKLAERSSRSAKEIADLIGNIQRGTDNAVKAMEVGTQGVERGSRLAQDAHRALEEILRTVQMTDEQIRHISNAALEIAQSGQDVVRAIDSVASITEENTAATEEISAGSQQVLEAVRSIAAISDQSAEAVRGVASTTDEITHATQNVAQAAQELAELAKQLQSMVKQFRV